jgi:hypothetical protein
MALSQGVCTSRREFAGKAELRRLFLTPAAFNAFMGDVAMWTGETERIFKKESSFYNVF